MVREASEASEAREERERVLVRARVVDGRAGFDARVGGDFRIELHYQARHSYELGKIESFRPRVPLSTDKPTYRCRVRLTPAARAELQQVAEKLKKR